MHRDVQLFYQRGIVRCGANHLPVGADQQLALKALRRLHHAQHAALQGFHTEALHVDALDRIGDRQRGHTRAMLDGALLHPLNQRVAGQRPRPVMHQHHVAVVRQHVEGIAHAVAARQAAQHIPVHPQARALHGPAVGGDILLARAQNHPIADPPQPLHAVADYLPAVQDLQRLHRIATHAGTTARRRNDGPTTHWPSSSPARRPMMYS